MTLEEAFGIVLRRLRRERNLTQDNLSEASSLDRAFISNIETGKQQPSLLSIYELAKALNVPASTMIFEVDFLLKIHGPTLLHSSQNHVKSWSVCKEFIMGDNHTKFDGKETILVADDEPLVRNMLHNVLTSHGYSVITAEDGQEALDKYHDGKDKIDLIVLDVVMPKKDGITTCNEIKSKNPNALVLLTSGYLSDLINSDNLDILQKPFSPVELVKRIRHTLDNAGCQNSK